MGILIRPPDFFFFLGLYLGGFSSLILALFDFERYLFTSITGSSMVSPR